MKTKEWIDRLSQECTLPQEGYRALLQMSHREDIDYLHSKARKVAQSTFGQKIFVRGLIEITNNCRNNCFYCGIRSSNREVERYSLSQEQILECCHQGELLGFKTFVLQGGEDPSMSDEWLVELVGKIRSAHPKTAITLSLGEKSREIYQRLFDAGANRYLLRHESHNSEHYQKLHPHTMSIQSRLNALHDLQEIGYQCGTGIMVGSPFQSIEHILEDILFIESFKPQMVGIGPFVPHHATPFANFAAGSVEQTLRLISIFRLMNPKALIPATTALATLATDGREAGILAGANVAMPNISPINIRKHYTLYDNKAILGSESGEGLKILRDRLSSIGYELSFNRGDYE